METIRGQSSTFIDAGTKLCANANQTDTNRGGMHRMKKQESTGIVAQK